MHTILLQPEYLAEFSQLFSNAIHLKKTNEYEFGRYKLEKLLIIIYNSGKVVFSEKPKGQIRDRIIEFLISRDRFDGPVIGSDEAGKGELIGPITVAATLLKTPEDRAYVRFCGAMDSKELSAKQLEEVSQIVKAYPHALRILSPHAFNVRFQKGSLNEILTEMHLSSITKLLQKIDQNEKCTVIIDKFGGKKDQSQLEKLIREVHPQASIIITTHAERFECVAAASIIAKNEYEKWIASYESCEKIPIRKLKKEDIAKHHKHQEFCKTFYLKNPKAKSKV